MTTKHMLRVFLLGFSAVLSMNALAAAPKANITGAFAPDVTLDGMIVQAGAAIGGNAELETSIGTVHGDSTGADFSPKISVGSGILGVSIVNAGLAVGGDICAKVSIGSVGASTCTYK